jgi:aspartokinase
MNASKLILWKDIDGIKQLNPRWGIETKSIPYLGYEEAAELSKHGTSVIHPATVSPLIEEGIPLEIRNMNSDLSIDAPTIVGPDLQTNDDVKAIGCQPGVAIIKSNGPLQSEVLSILEESDVTVLSISSTPESMRIILPSHDLHHLEDVIIGEVEYKTAVISIIGGGGDIHIECAHELISQDGNNQRFIIDTEDLPRALSELYQSLFSLQDCR